MAVSTVLSEFPGVTAEAASVSQVTGSIVPWLSSDSLGLRDAVEHFGRVDMLRGVLVNPHPQAFLNGQGPEHLLLGGWGLGVPLGPQRKPRRMPLDSAHRPSRSE